MASKTVPTKANLISTKKSLVLAKQGYDLMDRKRNILIREMMGMIDSATKIQNEIALTYSEAYDALQLAGITLGTLEEFANSVPIDDTLTIRYRSVMGVELPVAKLADTKPELHYGLADTNSQLDEAYLKFIEVKKLTLRLAEVESSVYRLAQAIQKTQKRANALQNIIIPQFTTSVAEITSALEEKEREEFSRLKVIKKAKEKQEQVN